jgi:hypothetical protein
VEKLWEKSQNFNDFENFEWEKNKFGMILGWCWDDLPLFIMLHHVSGLCGASVWVDWRSETTQSMC